MSDDPLLAIDPGNEESGFVVLDSRNRIVGKGIVPNEEMLETVQNWGGEVYIEKITSYGMSVGQSIFETVFWAGRFYEAAQLASVRGRISRSDVKKWLCHSTAAKDKNVNQRLADLWGPKGTKKAPGPTYGMAGDMWAALGVGATVRQIEDPIDWDAVLTTSAILA